jgi:antitoxin VapB
MVYQMGMNIKNSETQRLVQNLAALTGESLTAAITTAVRERLERLRCEHRTSLAERLVAIGKDCAPRLKEPFRSTEHGELLYDDHGLPR